MTTIDVRLKKALASNQLPSNDLKKQHDAMKQASEQFNFFVNQGLAKSPEYALATHGHSITRQEYN